MKRFLTLGLSLLIASSLALTMSCKKEETSAPAFKPAPPAPKVEAPAPVTAPTPTTSPVSETSDVAPQAQ